LNRRVVITGLGLLTPIGNSLSDFWQSMQDNRTGIRRITRFPAAHLRCQVAAEIDLLGAEERFTQHRIRRMDRYAQLSVLVAEQAVQHSRLALSPDAPRSDAAVSFGTALGGISNAEMEYDRYHADPEHRISPYLALQVFGGSAHSNIAIEFGAQGYGTTNSNSCASGTVALGEGFRLVREGLAQCVITGAAEAPLCSLTFSAFDVIKSMSKEQDPDLACRPFDAKRNGFVMGEGAGSLIVEELESAQKRGAPILAEVLGYSLNNDAYHMAHSRDDGACALRAMAEAVAQAGLKPEQIDYVNAHGSSTEINDRNEARAIHQFFGKHRPAVSATKGFYGHPLGASGAIEAVLSVLILQQGWIPPTRGCEANAFPEDIDLVLGSGRKQEVQTILSNSFGFGGINSAIVIGKYRP